MKHWTMDPAEMEKFNRLTPEAQAAISSMDVSPSEYLATVAEQSVPKREELPISAAEIGERLLGALNTGDPVRSQARGPSDLGGRDR